MSDETLDLERLKRDPAYGPNLLLKGFVKRKYPAFLTNFSAILDEIKLTKEAAWKMIDKLVKLEKLNRGNFRILTPSEIINGEVENLTLVSRLNCYFSLLQRIALGRTLIENKDAVDADYNMRRILLDITIRLIDLRKKQPSCSVYTSSRPDDDFRDAGVDVVYFLCSFLADWIQNPEEFMKSS